MSFKVFGYQMKGIFKTRKLPKGNPDDKSGSGMMTTVEESAKQNSPATKRKQRRENNHVLKKFDTARNSLSNNYRSSAADNLSIDSDISVILLDEEIVIGGSRDEEISTKRCPPIKPRLAFLEKPFLGNKKCLYMPGSEEDNPGLSLVMERRQAICEEIEAHQMVSRGSDISVRKYRMFMITRENAQI